jgi:hypothetical protein
VDAFEVLADAELQFLGDVVAANEGLHLAAEFPLLVHGGAPGDAGTALG